jgi:hypothetical protein
MGMRVRGESMMVAGRKFPSFFSLSSSFLSLELDFC